MIRRREVSDKNAREIAIANDAIETFTRKNIGQMTSQELNKARTTLGIDLFTGKLIPDSKAGGGSKHTGAGIIAGSGRSGSWGQTGSSGGRGGRDWDWGRLGGDRVSADTGGMEGPARTIRSKSPAKQPSNVSLNQPPTKELTSSVSPKKTERRKASGEASGQPPSKKSRKDSADPFFDNVHRDSAEGNEFDDTVMGG